MANGISAKKTKSDMYANVAFGNVTLSGVDTLTFSQIQMAVGLFQGVAMLLSRVLWYPSMGTIRQVVAATDSLTMALTSSSRLTDIDDTSDPAILTMRKVVGVGVNTEPFVFPLISDFSTLPGGGKLMSCNPIYLACDTGGFASAAVLRAQLDFTFVELSATDYLELIQSQYPASIS
jgi:hypothetical protein